MTNDQMGFDLGGPSPRPPRTASGGSAGGGRFTGDNLFIAARPDAAAAAAAQAIAHDYRALYRIDRQPLTDRRLHVSLIGIDRAPVLEKSLIYDARAAIDGVRFKPFEICLDQVMSFRSGASRPVVLAASRPNQALGDLLFRLAGKLEGLGVPFGFDPDFLVHMTLVYHDRFVMSDHLPIPIRWTVDRVWLIRSLVGQGSYEFLWPPKEPPDA